MGVNYPSDSQQQFTAPISIFYTELKFMTIIHQNDKNVSAAGVSVPEPGIALRVFHSSV